MKTIQSVEYTTNRYDSGIVTYFDGSVEQFTDRERATALLRQLAAQSTVYELFKVLLFKSTDDKLINHET